MFKIHVEPKSANEAVWFREILNRNRRSPRRGRVSCVEPKSPNEGFKMYDEPVSRQGGGVFKIYLLNRNRQIRGRVQDLC